MTPAAQIAAPTWEDILARLDTQAVAVSPLWPALVLIAIAIAWRPARRCSRTLATLVHEAGHAFIGILAGRRFHGFVVEADLSGRAVTSGKPRGLGRILTAWAGYPMPAIIGAGTIAAALAGWSGGVLLAVLLVLTVLLVMSRSWRTAGIVALLWLICWGLWWFGDVWRAGVLVGVGLLLLWDAWSAWRDVAASRNLHQDHGSLAQLTILPSWFWLGTWLLAIAACTAWAGWSLAQLWLS